MAELILIEELRAYLVAQGVVRLAEGAGGALPPCWLDPEDGAPEPDAADDATVTLTGPLTIPQEWQTGTMLEERIVDVVVRARSSARAELIQRQIKGQLEEKVNVFLGALRIEHCKLWRGDQKLASDETTYTRMQSFRIAARVKSLAGLPYAP